ncbi:Glycosyl transferase family 8 protein [Pleurostoma richardsiae]|uniref:Glycosyl transferase family 8 protein n=1 Tax=Pleurostoma richardsiae TaxID=41990 RepID=A0AA38S2I2_9PEZI|nr:Glycosyl transferase family 8 protein [Pleurostoma richardsiae]
MPRRHAINLAVLFSFVCLTLLYFRTGFTSTVTEVPSQPVVQEDKEKGETKLPPTPKYKPTPTYTPPPVRDPFPLLATSTPPPIPQWNVPRDGLHRDYDLPVAPPLLIGFTRTWPILLQAVVSYVTAGWPPSQIYVVENTGVQQANARDQLGLQNPFYLNHTQLRMLGVNIVQTPTLLNFAQLQNFFLSMSYSHGWDYYFWGHMDVLALSYEEGKEGLTPAYDQQGYKTIYELCCRALAEARRDDPRWGVRFFAYDHLALVNPEAYEDVGGWDTMIPYYLTDCDMHSRLLMANWTMLDAQAGIPTDTSVVLDDLSVLYRVPGITPDFQDPNPPPPPKPEEEKEKEGEGGGDQVKKDDGEQAKTNKRDEGGEGLAQAAGRSEEDRNLAYWRALRDVSDRMFHYKHGERGRNTWQRGQRGGAGEPFYYPADGLAEAMDVLTEAGREVYRRKWGHRDCDLIKGAGLQIGDQWLVEKDWE